MCNFPDDQLMLQQEQSVHVSDSNLQEASSNSGSFLNQQTRALHVLACIFSACSHLGKEEKLRLATQRTSCLGNVCSMVHLHGDVFKALPSWGFSGLLETLHHEYPPRVVVPQSGHA